MRLKYTTIPAPRLARISPASAASHGSRLSGESKRLLEGGTSVNAVADMLGFHSMRHFSRTFRNFIGISPREWLAGKAVETRETVER